jgi:hypothetical protein
LGYLTINPFIGDGFFNLDYLNRQRAIYEDDYLRHVRFKEPLTVIIEGKSNKAAIFKEGFKFNNLQNGSEKSSEDTPPEGFM